MTNNLIVFKRHEILKQIGSEQELTWLQCLSWNRKHGNEASKKKKKVANYSEYLLPHVNGNHKKSRNPGYIFHNITQYCLTAGIDIYHGNFHDTSFTGKHCQPI